MLQSPCLSAWGYPKHLAAARNPPAGVQASRSCGTGAHIVAFPWSAFAKQCPYQTPVVCIGMEGTLRGKHSRNEKETADLPRTEGNKGPGLFLFCRCFRRKETARNGVIPNIGEMEGEHPLLIRTGCNPPGGSAAGRRQEKQLEIHCQHCHRCGKITIGLSGKE